jgi:hypothetical protein
MGWAVGYDSNHKRDIGYGVPSLCDHPDCNAEIDRGLSYVCGGDVYGGEYGCGLFFCGKHRHYYGEADLPAQCERCGAGADPFEPKPDTEEWNNWKLTDPSWAEWRAENLTWVKTQGNAARPEHTVGKSLGRSQ